MPNDIVKDILNDLINYLQGEQSNGTKSIIVSPEFLTRWHKFQPLHLAKQLENISQLQPPIEHTIPERSSTYSTERCHEEKPTLKDEHPQHSQSVSKPNHTDLEEIVRKLNTIAEQVQQCTKCPLHTTRTHTVFGSGNPRAEIVFVGEAPGAEEDRQGLPFVGRAGQLLTDIIVKGMKMRREDVYICNVLKCRPPNNREPNPMEVYHCEPYLLEQLQIIRPKVICALGRVAAQTLLKTNIGINELRGKWHNYHGIPLRVTYHPAYLLRNPADKKKAWLDIQEIIKLLKGEITVEFENTSDPLFR